MMKYFFLISCIFCVVYGIVMFFTNITKTFFFIWLFLAFIFYIVYMIYQNGIIDIIPIYIRKTIFVLAILFIILFVIEFFDILKYYNKRPQNNLDYVIVLGALVTDNGPAMSTIYRLDETIAYLNENPNTKCILTGSKGSNEPDYESVVMAKYLINNNIDRERLFIEKDSFSTYENISNSKQFLDIDNNTVGIVTNNFHVRRALYLAENLGYKHIDGLASYSLPINALSNLCRETMAMIYYRLYFILFGKS